MLVAYGQIELDDISFMSPYYLKEAVLNTWTGEMTGFRVVDNFNKVNDGERVYIPHPDLRRTSRGRRKARHRDSLHIVRLGDATRPSRRSLIVCTRIKVSGSHTRLRLYHRGTQLGFLDCALEIGTFG